MTFPLGSLRAESAAGGSGTYTRDGSRPAPPVGPAPGLLKAQLRLLAGAAIGLLSLLALVTHSGMDAAFSTSGNGTALANKAGVVGAWFSDLA
ncbi:MAG: DNA translocase FtsK 4TM domain-containing protein, partial [Caldimonas sp.]